MAPKEKLIAEYKNVSKALGIEAGRYESRAETFLRKRTPIRIISSELEELKRRLKVLDERKAIEEYFNSPEGSSQKEARLARLKELEGLAEGNRAETLARLRGI